MEGGMNPLQTLRTHGQSVWLDFLSRDLLAKGELASRTDEDHVRFATFSLGENVAAARET